MDPCDEVDPLDGEFGCRWWAQLPFSLSLSLRPTKDGLGMCQESGLPATAVVAAVASIWKQRKSTWSFDCITDNVAPITLLLCLARMSSTCNRVLFICLSPHGQHYSTSTLYLCFICTTSIDQYRRTTTTTDIRTTRLKSPTITTVQFSRRY